MKFLSTIRMLVLALATFALLGFGVAMPGATGPALSASLNLAPGLLVTQSGSTGRQAVGNLALMDQKGLADDSTKYVSFTTPHTAYRGYRRYYLPGNIPLGSLTSLGVKVNYKGPAAASQTWQWYLYDWTAKNWVKVGDNALALTNRWKLLTFSTAQPRRFINSTTREIRVLLLSNNASGNARLDYESVLVGYNAPATVTPTQTITYTPTITPTPSATPSAVHFAAVGDFGVDNANEAAVATLVKSWNPDFVITMGDNNYLAGESSTIDQNIGKYYHEYIYPYSGVYGAGSPGFNRFFPTLGNHDWASATGADPYLAYFVLPNNERYYDFSQGPVHFFVIDSDPHEPDGTSSSSIQAVWLQNRLAATTEPWKIVYMHHPPYSSGAHGSTTYMQWDFKGWGADAVLTGHDHTYERLDVGGFPYFVNGLGGQDLYSFGTPVTGSLVRYNAQYGAMLIDATAAQITFQFIGVDGTVADTFSLP